MKIKTKEKDVPVVEVNLEFTKEDIKQLIALEAELDRYYSEDYADYRYDLNIDIETEEQVELIEKFIKTIEDLEAYI